MVARAMATLALTTGKLVGRWSARFPGRNPEPGPPARPADGRDSGQGHGRAMFSAALSRGTRWKLWKTKPMRRLRTRACSSGDRVVTSRFSRRWVPASVGREGPEEIQGGRRFSGTGRSHHRHILAGVDGRGRAGPGHGPLSPSWKTRSMPVSSR